MYGTYSPHGAGDKSGSKQIMYELERVKDVRAPGSTHTYVHTCLSFETLKAIIRTVAYISSYWANFSDCGAETKQISSPGREAHVSRTGMDEYRLWRSSSYTRFKGRVYCTGDGRPKTKNE